MIVSGAAVPRKTKDWQSSVRLRQASTRLLTRSLESRVNVIN